jgi:hypothetical protein
VQSRKLGIRRLEVEATKIAAINVGEQQKGEA